MVFLSSGTSRMRLMAGQLGMNLLFLDGFGGGVGGRRLSSKMMLRVSTNSYDWFSTQMVDEVVVVVVIGSAGNGLHLLLTITTL